MKSHYSATINSKLDMLPMEQNGDRTQTFVTLHNILRQTPITNPRFKEDGDAILQLFQNPPDSFAKSDTDKEAFRREFSTLIKERISYISKTDEATLIKEREFATLQLRLHALLTSQNISLSYFDEFPQTLTCYKDLPTLAFYKDLLAAIDACTPELTLADIRDLIRYNKNDDEVRLFTFLKPFSYLVKNGFPAGSLEYLYNLDSKLLEKFIVDNDTLNRLIILTSNKALLLPELISLPEDKLNLLLTADIKQVFFLSKQPSIFVADFIQLQLPDLEFLLHNFKSLKLLSLQSDFNLFSFNRISIETKQKIFDNINLLTLLFSFIRCSSLFQMDERKLNHLLDNLVDYLRVVSQMAFVIPPEVAINHVPRLIAENKESAHIGISVLTIKEHLKDLKKYVLLQILNGKNDKKHQAIIDDLEMFKKILDEQSNMSLDMFKEIASLFNQLINSMVTNCNSDNKSELEDFMIRKNLNVNLMQIQFLITYSQFPSNGSHVSFLTLILDFLSNKKNELTGHENDIQQKLHYFCQYYEAFQNLVNVSPEARSVLFTTHEGNLKNILTNYFHQILVDNYENISKLQGYFNFQEIIQLSAQELADFCDQIDKYEILFRTLPIKYNHEMIRKINFYIHLPTNEVILYYQSDILKQHGKIVENILLEKRESLNPQTKLAKAMQTATNSLNALLERPVRTTHEVHKLSNKLMELIKLLIDINMYHSIKFINKISAENERIYLKETLLEIVKINQYNEQLLPQAAQRFE